MKTLPIVLLMMLCSIAHGSLKPEEIIAAPASTYKGRSFGSYLTLGDIIASPVWDHTKDNHPPLSPKNAVAAALRVLASIIPQEEIESEWRLSAINLSPSTYSHPDEPKWTYSVTWTGPRIGYVNTKTGEFVTKRKSRAIRHREVYDQFRLFVLMNGKCIEPKELKTPNTNLEPISGSQ